MRKTLCILTLGWLSALMAVAQNGTEQTVIIGKATPEQRTTCIDRDWRFCYGDGSAAIAQPDVTSGWRLLDLPHDWSVETEAAQAAGGTVVGPFTTASIGGYQTAFTVGGEGWYAKRLSVKGKRHRYSRQIIYFEGAYNQTEVYVNGQKLHFNPYGYISFRVDVSDALHEGDNWLLVRVANEGNNSRWYAGSGIYRHVWLIQTPRDAYLDSWNLQATTHQQADGTWQLVVEAPIEGVAKGQQALQHTLYDAAGRKVVTVSGRQSRQVLRVEQPELWSPDHPYCYQLETQLMAGRKVKDRLTTRVGFRSLSFTADKGFLLNGQPMLIRGGCVHHDNGLLGAAAFDRAEVRRLQLIKAQGYNAVRTSHGLPSESFLNTCDTLGLMVVDETFDQWLMEKNPDDYHRFFPEHSTSDLQTMIRRCEELGVELLTEHRAADVEVTDGRITAVIAETSGGERVRITCRACVMAIGSWICNKEVVEKVCPAFNRAEVLPSAHQNPNYTGDGLPLAEKAGAFIDWDSFCLRLMGPICSLGDRSKLDVLTHTDYTVIVDKNARRFAAEPLAPRIDPFDTGVILLDHPAGKVYYLYSANSLRRAIAETQKNGDSPDFDPFGMPPLPELSVIDGWFREAMEQHPGEAAAADTVEELAAAVGLDPAALRQTVDEFNAGCAAGADWAYFKSAELLEPLAEGPFYAMGGKLATDGAFGGVRVDPSMQAYAADGSLVPGLFVTGDFASGRHIVLKGVKKQVLNDMSWALASGFLAGASAAESVK